MGISKGDITLNAKEALDGATRIIARTGSGDSFNSLSGYSVETLDYVYEKSRNFDTLNKNLASAVIKAAAQSPVCYCVDGAVCEDESCKIILSKHKDCQVLDGVSKAARAYSLSRMSSGEVARVSAYGVKNLKSCRAVCVYDIDCEYAASEVKQRLSDIFGEETFCSFVRGNQVKKIKIYEIDRQKTYGSDCAVTCEEAEFLKKSRYDYADLEYMIKLLRAPGGCPWDRAQTSQSIKKNMIEEAYELVDAIERDDLDGMEEETGDVLLQAAFHSVMEEEKGEFNGADAITRVIKKLIFRHSHIFGGDKAEDDTEALAVWERNKKQEKGQTTYSDSVVAVPKNMPACMRAQKVGKRSAKCGMDFLSPVSAAEKLWEEINELLVACKEENAADIFEESGDVLFSAVNVCRLAGADCEEALQAASDKFIKRFSSFEELATQNGEKIEEMDPSRRDYYWALAKDAVKKG